MVIRSAGRSMSRDRWAAEAAAREMNAGENLHTRRDITGYLRTVAELKKLMAVDNTKAGCDTSDKLGEVR